MKKVNNYYALIIECSTNQITKRDLMSDIEWTDKSWNPFVGCSPKPNSPACDHCYAILETRRKHTSHKSFSDVTVNKKGVKWTGKINRGSDDMVNKPLNTNDKCIFFVCSLSDFFHKNATDDLRLEAMDIIAQCPQHTFQILTKRPENINPFLKRTNTRFPDNVWVGATVENLATMVERIPLLLEVDCVLRFLSIEPLLEDLGDIPHEGLHWLIVGGESGRGKRRPMKADWVRRVQTQAKEADIPFFFKQWGKPGNNPIATTTPAGEKIEDWVQIMDPYSNLSMKNKDRLGSEANKRTHKAKGGALLDGKLCQEMPSKKLLAVLKASRHYK
jgi:protein gp37